MRFLTTFSLTFLALSGVANAQCAGGLIVNCPAAVSPQPTDVINLWQLAQAPHMRKLPLSQILSTGLTASFASPPPIGSTAPNTGAFTTLSATGTVSGTGFTTLLSPYLTTSLAGSTYAPLASPTFTGTPAAPTVAATAAAGTTQLATTAFVRNGTTTNDSALSGQVGEFVSSTVLVGSAVSLTTNTAANVTSVSLTAGDWDCRGNVVYALSVSASNIQAWVSAASATQPTSPNAGAYTVYVGGTYDTGSIVQSGTARESLATTTTVYLGGFAGFTSGTAGAYGFLGCRRMR